MNNKMFLILVFLSLMPIHAQSPFEAIPKQVASKYHFDLSRNFFVNPAEEEVKRVILYQKLAKFNQLRGKTTISAKNLILAMSEFDSLQTELGLHLTYLYLRYAMDTRNTESLNESNKLTAEANLSTSFLQSELMNLDDATLARFFAQSPKLKKYNFAIESARRYRSYTLASEQEAIITVLTPSLINWQSALFSQTLANTEFGIVNTQQGDLNLKNNAREIFNNPERAVRETGYRQNRSALALRRETYAFALLRTVAARTQIARLRRFPDYPTEFYFNLYLTKSNVSEILERLARQAGVNKRFERLRVEHIKQTTGYTEVHPWDLNVTPPGTVLPRFTIEEATRIIKAATASFGEEYARELAALLDPANGRLDIAPREFRINRPGFSSGGPDRPSVFYSGGFQGYLEDVIILAHEGGHAVQNMLMNNRRVLPVYSAGPDFLTESFAGLNELLLLDYLYRNATDPVQRIYFLEKFLDQATEIFKTARESMVELQLYDRAIGSTNKSGEVVRNADDIESLMQKTGARFSLWFGPQSERNVEWVNVIHYYTRPLYRINYVYSKLLALKYFDLYTKDRKGFVAAYSQLLKNGYDVPPDELLKKAIGTNTHEPQLLDDAIEVINRKITELELLYRQ
jgi:oligoendopeptidase F